MTNTEQGPTHGPREGVMGTLSMSDIHALVTSGEWDLANLQAAMPHLDYTDALAQYAAILESGR